MQKPPDTHGKVSTEAILKVYCPKCNSPPGEPCTNNSGRMHLERMKKVQLWRKFQKKEWKKFQNKMNRRKFFKERGERNDKQKVSLGDVVQDQRQ